VNPVSADGGGTRFPYPRGKTPEQIFDALRVLVDTLNREQSGDQIDLDALNAAIAAAQVQINAILEDIDEIETGGALTAQQAFELSLVTAVDTLLGSVSKMVRDSIAKSEMAAEATIRALLEGRKNEVGIRVEQQARLTDREAFVSQFSEFNAQLGLTQGQITEEIQARADGDSANAELIQTVSTALNGNIAQVQILATSIDGIEQKFAVTLNNNGQVTGLIQLDGTAAGSNFTVVADTFLVAQPDAAGGAPVPVFSIQTVGSTPKLAIRGDMIANGTITAQKLVAATLSAISANLGTITAGLIRNTGDTLRFDLPNMRIYRPDGKFDMDAKNLRFRIGSG
jgi:hypothetical protein